MAARTIPRLPPRTPSPKVRIHRSQSFDSPSSRISVTPIDDSPYSKSANDIITKPLPRYNALQAAENGMLAHNKVILHTKMSDDSIMSDASSASSSTSSTTSSPTSISSRFGLFNSGSPNLPPSPSSAPQHQPCHRTPHSPPEILSSTLDMYQEPNTPMYDPWLVRVVLDMHDMRGFDWMSMAEPIERIWGIRTTSAEVLDILSGNGRVGRRWWD